MACLHSRPFSPTHCRLSLKAQPQVFGPAATVDHVVLEHEMTGERLPVRPAPRRHGHYPPTRWP